MGLVRYTASMNADKTLADWRRAAPSLPLPPAALRLAAAVPEAQEALDRQLTDPLHRALAGLGPPPDWRLETDLRRAALGALRAAELEAAMDLTALDALERAATSDPEAWVIAAQAHALASPERERRGRMRLAAQELPFAAPGELHPLVVEVLAVGDRVLPALHVDWVRKLTALAADALPLDARALGLWFWPVLRSLPVDRLLKPLQRLHGTRRLPDGARGLCAAYLARVGGDPDSALEGASEADLLIAALAVLGDRGATS